MATIDLGMIEVTTETSDCRGLTQGEIEILRPYFGDSMNYDEVRIERNSIIFADSGLSIGGTMYVDPVDFSSDYSAGGLGERTWFMHEMTHAWQSQNGYQVFLNGLVLLTQGGSQYDYRLDSLNPISFDNYNMESQADLIAHYYALENAENYEQFARAIGGSDYAYLTQGYNENALIQTVGEFINSNHDSSWLPNETFALDYIRDDIGYSIEKNLVIGSGKIILDENTSITFSASVVDG